MKRHCINAESSPSISVQIKVIKATLKAIEFYNKHLYYIHRSIWAL
jgi:hypothetical protein